MPFEFLLGKCIAREQEPDVSNRLPLTAISLMSCSLIFSSGALSNDLLSNQEILDLQAIESQYNSAFNNLDIEQELAQQKKLNAELENSQTRVIESKEYIKNSSEFIQKALMSGDNASKTLEGMQEASSTIKYEMNKIAQLNSELNQLDKSINMKESDLLELEKTKYDQLVGLYSTIKSRIIENSAIVHSKNIHGNDTCNIDTGMRACLEEIKPDIKNNFAKSNGGIDSIEFKEFRFVDASLSLNGTIRYEVALKYHENFTLSKDLDIKSKLGLNNILITLKSDSDDTKFYVNDKYVGKGRIVSHVGVLGSLFNLKAVNQDKKQSIKATVEKGDVFYFPFGDSEG